MNMDETTEQCAIRELEEETALMAPYNDRSLLRNNLTLALAQGYMEYVPQARPFRSTSTHQRASVAAACSPA